ncbi:hypothetical protein GCM10022247_06720 [Allokutzneria multivorans]|uniref:Uncharacterized protein n=1 Tax=Allokutzneria multivorans TaxID=1142134 RepID=A0ABP7R267_9PSEU
MTVEVCSPNGYGVNADLAALPDSTEDRVVPQVNPDSDFHTAY